MTVNRSQSQGPDLAPVVERTASTSLKSESGRGGPAGRALVIGLALAAFVGVALPGGPFSAFDHFPACVLLTRFPSPGPDRERERACGHLFADHSIGVRGVYGRVFSLQRDLAKGE